MSWTFTLARRLRVCRSFLLKSPSFDLIFIDADKPNNPAYLEWAPKLSRPGIIIIALATTWCETAP